MQTTIARAVPQMIKHVIKECYLIQPVEPRNEDEKGSYIILRQKPDPNKKPTRMNFIITKETEIIGRTSSDEEIDFSSGLTRNQKENIQNALSKEIKKREKHTEYKQKMQHLYDQIIQNEK